MNFTAEFRKQVMPKELGSFVELIRVAEVSVNDVTALHNSIINVPV